MKRNRRYFKARYWAECRAKATPGVVCTGMIDDYRVSVTWDGIRFHYHEWQCFEEETK